MCRCAPSFPHMMRGSWLARNQPDGLLTVERLPVLLEHIASKSVQCPWLSFQVVHTFRILEGGGLGQRTISREWIFPYSGRGSLERFRRVWKQVLNMGMGTATRSGMRAVD